MEIHVFERLPRQALADALRHVPAGIVIAEATTGAIVLSNPEAERIWRAPLSPGNTSWHYHEGQIFHLNGQPYQPSELPLLRSIRDGEIVTGENMSVKRADGTSVILMVNSAPVRNSEQRIIAGVVAYMDITDWKLAEAELRDAQARLQGLIHSVDGIVWELDIECLLIDNNFTFSFVSQQAERLLGYPLDEWYQPDFWRKLVHPDDRDWAVEFCQERTANLEPHDFEYRVLTRDGRVVWLRDIVSVEASHGRPTALRGIMVDVTAYKQAESDRERLLVSERAARQEARTEHHRSAFLAAVSSRLASSLDFDQTLAATAELTTPFLADWSLCAVRLPNGTRRAACAVADSSLADFGHELEQLAVAAGTGASLLEIPDAGAPVLCSAVTEDMLDPDADSALSSDHRHLDIIRALGLTSYMAVPLATRGRSFGVQLLASARRRYDLRDLALAQEVANRAALALDNARLYCEAQDAIRLREEFLSIASHELYTPVTSMQLVVEGITSGAVAPSPDNLTRAFKLVRHQIHRLMALTSELLDVSRIQAGRLPLHREPVDLAALVRHIVNQFEADLARAQCPLSLRAGEPVVGHWDRSRLERIVANLLSNAIKFGPGKPIGLTVANANHAARLVVEDHGTGIPRERLPHIFDRFERAVSARAYGGLGLGLYLVRTSVEDLGGTVHVDSELGQGSTFTIELPRTARAQA